MTALKNFFEEISDSDIIGKYRFRLWDKTVWKMAHSSTQLDHNR